MVHGPDFLGLLHNVDLNIVRWEVHQMLYISRGCVRRSSQSVSAHPLLLEDKLFVVQRLNGLAEAAEATIRPVRLMLQDGGHTANSGANVRGRGHGRRSGCHL